jgi:hypothetical protein
VGKGRFVVGALGNVGSAWAGFANLSASELEDKQLTLHTGRANRDRTRRPVESAQREQLRNDVATCTRTSAQCTIEQ